MEIKWTRVDDRLPNEEEIKRARQTNDMAEMTFITTNIEGKVSVWDITHLGKHDIVAWAELPQPYQPPHTYLDEFLKRLGTDRSKADDKTIEAIKEYTYVCDLIETDTKNNFCREYGKECDGCWEREYKEVDNV